MKIGIGVALLSALSLFQTYAGQILENFINLGRRQNGSVPVAGTTAGGDYYTIVGGGYDIWDRADECGFAYHEISGDFDIKVQVIEFLGTTDPDACCPKAGIMVRENLAEDSRRAMMAVGGLLRNNNQEFLWRTGLLNSDPANPGGGEGRNGGMHSTGAGAPTFPNAWIRMVREGALFTGFYSADGENWTQLQQVDSTGWKGGAMPSRLVVGLAVSPHNANDAGVDRATAIFTNYTETASRFCVGDVSSRGAPNKVFVSYTRPYGAQALESSFYTISAGAVNSVSAGPDAKTVLLDVEALTEGTTYTVTVDGLVDDVNGNVLDGSCVSGSFMHGKGYEQRRIHVQHNVVIDGNEDFVSFWQAYKLGIGNWAINRPGFEGNTVFDDPMPNEGSCPENWGSTELTAHYAGRILGLLTPTTSGNFTFAAANDDAIRVWLSKDSNLDAKQQIIARGCCIGYRNFGDAMTDGAGHSAAQALVAGKRYALDAAYEEGCGGNYGHVAWDGDGLAIVNGKSPIQESFFTPSRFFASTLFLNLGDVSVITQPVPATATEGQTATFAVTADGTPPYRYQWKRDGVVIPGATGRTFTTPALTPEWDNAQVSVCVANEFSETCSDAAALTVIFDNTSPTLVSAEPYPDPTMILVHFNEPMEAATAADAGNYVITGGSAAPGVSSVVLLDDLSTAKLTLDTPLEPNTSYTVQVSDVRDRAVNPNTLAPNPSSASFISFMGAVPGVVLYEIWNGIGGTALSDLTGNAAYPNNPTVVGSITTLDSRLFYANDDVSDYGARMTSWLIPTVTGDYTFDQFSDDAGVLYLGRTGDPSSAVAIAGQSGCCAHIASAPVRLVAGQPYFIQTLYKEGGGGDVGQIQWKAPGDSGFSFIPSANLVMCARMDDLTQPADVTSLQNRAVTFCVGAGVGLNGLDKQWSLLGAPIDGATGLCYTTPLLATTDEGNEYACEFSFMGTPLFTTRTAILHVNQDAEPPYLMAVNCDPVNPSQITFVYSEAVQAESATDGANYAIDGSSPNEAYGTLLADGRSVVFTLPVPYGPGSTHAIEVAGVNDLAGLTMDTTNFTWTACPPVKGWAKYDIYPGGSGATLDITLNDPNYPNNPSVSGYIRSMNSREFYPNDAVEQYGARMRAYFVPPTSGNWIFQMRSDDAARLSFNASGTDFAGMAVIHEYANCCEGWEAHQSAPFALVAGQYYAIELLYREGGGGDYGGVVARLATAPVVTGTDLNLSIPGCYLAVAINPPLNQTLTLAGPTDIAQPVGTVATFTVTPTVTGTTLTPSYQWEISTDAGATWQALPCVNSASYATAPLTQADNGKIFRCTATLPGIVAMSGEAVLTITDAPAVVNVTTLGDLNNVYVTWNMPVQVVGTYEINDVVVNGASVMAGQPNVVVVNTEDIVADTTHTLTITGELNEGGTVQFPNPTVVTFKQGPGRFCTDFSSLPPGLAIFGNTALNADGSVHLTEAVNSLQGSMVADIGQPVSGFKVRYRMLMGDGTTGQADGMSFSFGNDVAFGSFGEGGSGSGVIVRFNTYAGWYRGILLYWKGAEIARAPYAPAEVFTTPAQWADMDIEMTPEGQVTVKHAGNTVFNKFQIPGFTPITGNARIGFGARTGGENQKCYIDDLCFNDFTLGPAVATVSPATATVAETFTATFTAVASGSPWLYYSQWYSNGVAIAGANGPTYTTTPVTSLNEGDEYTCLVSNAFSSSLSSVGVIHVLGDLILLGCSTKGDPDNVYLAFNKPVALAGVYEVIGTPGIADEWAIMPEQPNVVRVHVERLEGYTAGIPEDGTYTVKVSGEQDATGNASVPDPVECSFTQPLARFCEDFSGELPVGSAVSGTATLTDGSVHLTEQVNSQAGYYSILLPTTETFFSGGFKAQWQTLILGVGGADGFTFNVGNDPTPADILPYTGGVAEQGSSVGLSVAVDTYNNGAADAGLKIRYNGTVLAQLPVGPGNDGAGAPAELALGQFVDTSAEVSPSGLVTFKYATYTLTAQIPNYSGITANKYEFAARTGGANAAQYIDNVCINNFTLGAVDVAIAPPMPSVLAGTRVAFTAVVTGSPWLTYQWAKDGVPIPGATAATYTTPPVTDADNGAVFSVVVNNSFSSDSADTGLTVLGTPIVLSADTMGFADRVYVTFNKPVGLEGVYTIDGGAVAVTGAAYGASESIVVLTTEFIPANVEHTLDVLDVSAATGDILEPNPTTVTFLRAESPFPWTVGLKDNGWPCPGVGGGPQACFVQENGAISALPGSPWSPVVDQQSDNDYYFAGLYSTTLPGVTSIYGSYTPVGLVTTNEPGAERAFAGGDLDLRYHFNLPSTLTPDEQIWISYSPLNLDDTVGLDTNSRFGVEVYFNGVKVQTNIVMRAANLGADFYTVPFTLASVGAQVGPGYDNVVSLKGVSYNGEGGGNWMGIDYVQLNRATCGLVSIVPDTTTPGNVIVSWNKPCRLQAAAALGDTPAQTQWIDVPYTSPLSVPVPYVDPQFGSLPMLYFRTISP